MKLSKINHYKSISSTNKKALELAKKGIHDRIIIADTQVKGKGRFNRTWYSSKGGAYFSILIKIEKIEHLKYLTFAAALSVLKTIEKITKLKPKIKWPNDVYINDKKVCGILTESTTNNNLTYAIIGIGINVNQKRFPKSIKNIATSMFKETNKEFNIKKIIIKTKNNFLKYYNLIKNNNYKKIIDETKKHSLLIEKNIKIKTLNKTHIGKVIDIDKNCRLIIKKYDNKIIKIIEGDIISYN